MEIVPKEFNVSACVYNKRGLVGIWMVVDVNFGGGIQLR